MRRGNINYFFVYVKCKLMVRLKTILDNLELSNVCFKPNQTSPYRIKWIRFYELNYFTILSNAVLQPKLHYYVYKYESVQFIKKINSKALYSFLYINKTCSVSKCQRTHVLHLFINAYEYTSFLVILQDYTI